MRNGLRVIITLIQPVQLFDDTDIGEPIRERTARNCACLYAVDDVFEFALPRVVTFGEFPARDVGWPHLRQHFVQSQTLDTVAAAESVDLQLAGTTEDLEAEQVFPFGPARVQPGDGARLQT